MNLQIKKSKEIRIIFNIEYEEEHTIKEAEIVRNQLTKLIRNAKSLQKDIDVEEAIKQTQKTEQG